MRKMTFKNKTSLSCFQCFDKGGPACIKAALPNSKYTRAFSVQIHLWLNETSITN